MGRWSQKLVATLACVAALRAPAVRPRFALARRSAASLPVDALEEPVAAASEPSPEHDHAVVPPPLDVVTPELVLADVLADVAPLPDAALADVTTPTHDEKSEKPSFLDRYPLAAKSLSMGITYGLADTAAQIFDRLARGEVAPLAYRLRRGLSLSAVGCLAVGPLLAVWFDFLERIVPGKNKRAIFGRTCLDQAIEVPVMISIIFTLSSLAEGHNLAFCLAKIQLKLLKTWRDCVGVWFPVQFVNQGFVPLKYRVIFQAVISFFWDAYLSIVSHA